jgi:hypothetical protein
VPNGKALELAELYVKAPEVTRRNTRVHFIQPLKERIVRGVGYGLVLPQNLTMAARRRLRIGSSGFCCQNVRAQASAC